jgi:hypothetical protein
LNSRWMQQTHPHFVEPLWKLYCVGLQQQKLGAVLFSRCRPFSRPTFIDVLKQILFSTFLEKIRSWIPKIDDDVEFRAVWIFLFRSSRYIIKIGALYLIFVQNTMHSPLNHDMNLCSSSNIFNSVAASWHGV